VEHLLYVSNRKEWRAWLKKNYKNQKEVWLVYYKKQSGKPRIAYNDAVEEALCFGWIDSTVKTIDDEKFAQRFSVRKPNSAYSQANKERLRKLIEEGKLAKEVLATIGNISEGRFKIPPDILERSLQEFSTLFAHVQTHPSCFHRRGA
jgi:uncharacterized protein YdeI (YjbR/CyaY-like superfamily)